MREILFRGKTEEGEWLCGGVLQNEGYSAIIEYSDYHHWHKFVEVIPKTVGQFTGLTDKNGKKIFEGDIVRCYFADGYEEKGVIKWSDEDVRFAFVPLDEEYRWGIDNTDKFEVIGNIHDC